VVAASSQLWSVLRKVQEKNIHNEQPVPERFHHDLAHAREITAKLIHPAGKITSAEASQLSAEVSRIRKDLETYLEQGASPAASSKGKPSHVR
jgi:hypothetical protein